ncbi:hypothetical protein CMUS01_11766 [Colletotrichum musicola]|uniref:Uncharacterized protein n=1 Tax=Colletotrichum musicola TaxID=2175873 RepID=A0A8H6JUF2_9PEZI|nr:hypothetical protein CMUS01_11766 [Colletotrichum musicola]
MENPHRVFGTEVVRGKTAEEFSNLTSRPCEVLVLRRRALAVCPRRGMLPGPRSSSLRDANSKVPDVAVTDQFSIRPARVTLESTEASRPGAVLAAQAVVADACRAETRSCTTLVVAWALQRLAKQLHVCRACTECVEGCRGQRSWKARTQWIGDDNQPLDRLKWHPPEDCTGDGGGRGR